MGYFYFDESIHERGGFILGAFVYSREDISPLVFQAIKELGLEPGKDEFKSGMKMAGDTIYSYLRDQLLSLLHKVKLGLVVVPSYERKSLGREALRGLYKIFHANKLSYERHFAYFDQGITFEHEEELIDELNLWCYFDIYTDQDSRKIAGLQIADLCAHIFSTMLLEKLGLIKKRVKFENDSNDINLGFELWAYVRYYFFTQDNINPDVDQYEGFTLNTEAYALHISDSCSPNLSLAVRKRFGTMYMGCIH